MYTQKQIEELAKSAHTIVRGKDGKIIKLVRNVGGQQEEITEKQILQEAVIGTPPKKKA